MPGTRITARRIVWTSHRAGFRHQRLFEPDHHVVGNGLDPAEQQVAEHGMLAVLFHRITFFQFIDAILDVGALVVRAKRHERLEIGIGDNGLEGIGRESHRQLAIGCTLGFVGFPVDDTAPGFLPVGKENRDVGGAQRSSSSANVMRSSFSFSVSQKAGCAADKRWPS